MRVAAVQVAPVWGDATGTTKRVVEYLEQAASQDVKLCVFPETFLPGFPFWGILEGGGPLHDSVHDAAYAAYLDSSVEIDGAEMLEIIEAVDDLGVFTYLGVAERGVGSGRGTIYSTLAAIDPERGLVGAHRKLVPTHGERMIWGPGDGAGLGTHLVNGVRVGGLNCWENWMPLARHALYADGEEIHVAAWPGSSGFNRDIPRFIALEGRVGVVLASGLLDAEDVPASFPLRHLLDDKPPGAFNGGSSIVAPDGSWIVEQVIGEQRLLVGDINPASIRAARASFDPAGHYSRPDIFQVTVDRRRRKAAAYLDEEGETS